MDRYDPNLKDAEKMKRLEEELFDRPRHTNLLEQRPKLYDVLFFMHEVNDKAAAVVDLYGQKLAGVMRPGGPITLDRARPKLPSTLHEIYKEVERFNYSTELLRDMASRLEVF